MISLNDFQMNAQTGYLPANNQKVRNSVNQAWYDFAEGLPKWLLTGKSKAMIANLPDFQEDFQTEPEAAMRIISYIGQAYLWGETEVPQILPQKLAKAWCMVADAVGRPPILSYPSYCLYNFEKIDVSQPAHIGNIKMIQNFLGGADEDWFILIHVDIEARAARALTNIPLALNAAKDEDEKALEVALNEIHESLLAINHTMNRMPEYCDPYIYYTRVRPYIFGTKNNPSLPNGLIYEGCFDNQPQFFRGETGAQSSIVPALDGVLGVVHANDPLKEYLMEMRDYMVPAHKRFIETVESTSTVRTTVQISTSTALKDIYNACVDELFRFRAKHLEYAATYIHKQAAQSNNSTSVGTGGTPFMEYLAKHRDETKVSTL